MELWNIVALFNRTIDLMSKVFANGTGAWGSIPGQVIPKTQKMLLDAALLNTQHYKVRIKGKVEQSREWSSALPTPRCSSYWKRSLWVTLNWGWQLYLLIALFGQTKKSITASSKLKMYHWNSQKIFPFMKVFTEKY